MLHVFSCMYVYFYFNSAEVKIKTTFSNINLRIYNVYTIEKRMFFYGKSHEKVCKGPLLGKA